jgi:uncharacterized RDD family membrane protein YckC
MAETSRQFDTSVDLVTPENIAFRYHIAGPFQRLWPYLIDCLIRIAFLMALAMALVCSGALLTGSPYFGMGILAVIAFLADWFYGGVFEAVWNGQTPGKRMCRMRVVSVDGSPITGMQAVLRNFLRFADLMPIAMFSLDGQSGFQLPTLQVGLLVMAITNRYQRLGDLAAGTMVVVEEPQRRHGVVRFNDPLMLRLADEIPRSFQPSRSLTRALSAYVERREMLAWPRRAEIARHLGELLCERFGLPPDTSHDMLLCALYHKTFIDDRGQEGGNGAPPPGTMRTGRSMTGK